MIKNLTLNHSSFTEYSDALTQISIKSMNNKMMKSSMVQNSQRSFSTVCTSLLTNS